MDEPLEEAYIFLSVSGAHGIPVKSVDDSLGHFGYSNLVEWLVRSAGNASPNANTTWTRQELFKGKNLILSFYPSML